MSIYWIPTLVLLSHKRTSNNSFPQTDMLHVSLKKNQGLLHDDTRCDKILKKTFLTWQIHELFNQIMTTDK